MLQLRKVLVFVAIVAPIMLACDERNGADSGRAETAPGDDSASAADDAADDADDGEAEAEDDGGTGGTDGGTADDGASDGAPMPDPNGGADFGICLQACSEPSHCCFDGIECGKYPNSWECNDDGVCIPLGCTGDGDCTYIAGTTCELTGGFAQCVMVCASDDDCITDLGERCIGVTDEGAGFCVIPNLCAADDECNPDGTTSFVCTNGACLCDGDEDCGNFGGTCELETGLCHCTGNATCPDGLACAA